MAIVEVSHLQKTFQTAVRREGRFGTVLSLFKPLRREVTAVNGINFRIEPGESVAYLGPNGAGKSTTIKMLTGILVPSGGEVRVRGVMPYRERQRNSYQIGVVFGQRSQLLYDLPVKDSFELLRHMYSIPAVRYRENLKKFAALLEVEPLLGRSVRTLSLGQRMRCEILSVLLHEPEILFLDEPTIGLDVVAKETIRNFIGAINRERGVTVLLTTHDLGDIERLCKRVMIIDKGRLIYDGDLQFIKENFATERRVRLVMPDAAAATELAAGLKADCALQITVTGPNLTITYNHHQTDTAELLRGLLTRANPRDLSMNDENLEALIRRIYREGVGGLGTCPDAANQ